MQEKLISIIIPMKNESDESYVRCIAKGKVHKKDEFGNKVGIVSTIRNSFILAVESFSNNPYDGHTLQSLLSGNRI